MEEEGTNRYEGKCQALAQIFKEKYRNTQAKQKIYFTIENCQKQFHARFTATWKQMNNLRQNFKEA